jgi:hypothetical protein
MLAILTYGCEGWILDKDIRRKLNGFNSQCCARISGRTPHEEAGKPSYNLIYHIMHIRWKYVGQLLRAECDNIARRELLLTALMVIHKRISHKGTLLGDKRVWLPESVGFDVGDRTDPQNRGFSDDPGLGQ